MIKISCAEHEDMEVRSIDLSDDQTKFLCDECMIYYQFQKKTVNLDKILFLAKLFDKQTFNVKSQPEYILSKLNVLPDLKALFNDFFQYDEQKLKKQWIILDKQIEQMLETLVKVRQELQTYINQIIINRNYLLDKLNNIIQLDELKQIITELKTQTSDSDSKNQIEERFKKYFIELQQKKFNVSIINTLFDACVSMENQDSRIPNFELFKQKVAIFFQDVQKSLDISKPNQHPNRFIKFNESNILKMSSQNLLRKKIQAKSGYSIVQMERLKSDLDFWYQCNNKNYLLIILKLKNQKGTFGGFSSCTWTKPQAEIVTQGKNRIEIQPVPLYVEDTKLFSFLFYENQEKIMMFNLIENSKQFAIKCDQNSGPIFGAGPDFQIYQDFKRAVWKPEGSYQLKDLNGLDQEIEIEKFEIYKITFKH